MVASSSWSFSMHSTKAAYGAAGFTNWLACFAQIGCGVGFEAAPAAKRGHNCSRPQRRLKPFATRAVSTRNPAFVDLV